MATIPSDGSPMLGEHIFSAEDAAFEKRTLLNILDSIHESILIIDAQTRVCYVNDSYLKMFGIQREKIIGRHLAKFEPLARIHEVLKTGVPLTGDISHIHSAQLDVCADIVPLCQDGRIIGALALMKNMTELVQTNRELEHFKQLSEHLQNELASKDDLPPAFRNVLGHSKSFVTVLRTAARAAPSEASICIMGESGVGKEVVAEALHYSSRRAGGPLIKINCAAIPENLMESELFGYEEGAFTGAKKGGKKGYFEMAYGGTLFLDEIGEIPFQLQGKLLEVLQSKTFFHVGGTRQMTSDVRLIAATNKNLKEMVREKRFREDLFYRINVFPIDIPPLRERRGGIYSIVMDILPDVCNRLGIEPLVLSSQAYKKILQYPWPGNIRELENVLEKAAILSDGKIILPDDVLLPDAADSFMAVPATLQEIKESAERNAIVNALRLYQGDKERAAEYLAIGRTNIFDKIKKYHIRTDEVESCF